MLIEEITKERLEIFYKNQIYLQKLAAEIEGFKRNYNFLKSNSDYTKIHVTNGSKKQSEEEIFLQFCERKSKEYDSLKKRLEAEKAVIETQIKRVTNPTYQKILTRRYLYLEDWKLITMDLYGSKDDWFIWGNTKYELLVMNLHKRARDMLIKISKTAFLPETEQQTIEELT